MTVLSDAVLTFPRGYLHTPGYALPPGMVERQYPASEDQSRQIKLSTVVKVSEVFDSIQGEGPSTGRYARFVRMIGCNLHCSWCDTPFAWKPGEVTAAVRYSLADILYEQRAPTQPKPGLLVITGGEPLLYAKKDWMRLLVANAIYSFPHGVEFETNGTVTDLPPWQELFEGHERTVPRLRFNISPKLASAGAGESAVDYDWWLATHQTGQLCWKFVVASEADLKEVDEIVAAHSLARETVWLMPEGSTLAAANLGLRLVDSAMSRGYNFSARLHTLIWGSERGR